MQLLHLSDHLMHRTAHERINRTSLIAWILERALILKCVHLLLKVRLVLLLLVLHLIGSDRLLLWEMIALLLFCKVEEIESTVKY